MKILLAIDGSENSLRAADYAAFLAENFPESSVTIAYVDTLFFSDWKIDFGSAENVSDETDPKYVFKEKVKKALKKAKKKMTQKNIKHGVEILEHDNVAEALSKYAKYNGIDHIVMGTRGLGNFTGMLMGSASHKIVQLTSCPVTLVK